MATRQYTTDAAIYSCVDCIVSDRGEPPNECFQREQAASSGIIQLNYANKALVFIQDGEKSANVTITSRDEEFIPEAVSELARLTSFELIEVKK